MEPNATIWKPSSQNLLTRPDRTSGDWSSKPLYPGLSEYGSWRAAPHDPNAPMVTHVTNEFRVGTKTYHQRTAWYSSESAYPQDRTPGKAQFGHPSSHSIPRFPWGRVDAVVIISGWDSIYYPCSSSLGDCSRPPAYSYNSMTPLTIEKNESTALLEERDHLGARRGVVNGC